MTVAAANWAYLSLRREGKHVDADALLAASIHADMQILENDAYFRLCRMYQGAIPSASVLPADPGDEIGLATSGYAVGAWEILEGRGAEGWQTLERVAASAAWPAFGVIAAEADLARRQRDR
jgi:hypothetical protein